MSASVSALRDDAVHTGVDCLERLVDEATLKPDLRICLIGYALAESISNDATRP
jgi:hypothetical protein